MPSLHALQIEYLKQDPGKCVFANNDIKNIENTYNRINFFKKRLKFHFDKN